MKKIINDVYPIELYVLSADESDKINEIFGEDLQNPIEEIGVGAYCCTDQKGKLAIVIGDEDVVALAHECLHAANLTFKLIGAKVDVDNDEPHAYLFSWLFQNALIESGLGEYENF